MFLEKCSKIKSMDNILPENEYTEVDGRAYLNPQVALDESNTFIDNLRATQGQQNQEIVSDTQMLGTDVPSNLGGLTGAESYFTSRYQTPMTNAAVNSLRATAQAAALNQILQNEQAIWKKRYQDAYRDYQKRSYNKAYGGGSGGNSGGNNSNTSTWSGGKVNKEVIEPTNFYGVPGTNVTETEDGWVYEDPQTGEKVTVSKEYMNKLYDENGNLTDEGAVILDTRRLLGL